MFYVVQFKPDETVVHNVFRDEDAADTQYDKLSEQWPNAYFDVLNEVEMDSLGVHKC